MHNCINHNDYFLIFVNNKNCVMMIKQVESYNLNDLQLHKKTTVPLNGVVMAALMLWVVDDKSV